EVGHWVVLVLVITVEIELRHCPGLDAPRAGAAEVGGRPGQPTPWSRRVQAPARRRSRFGEKSPARPAMSLADNGVRRGLRWVADPDRRGHQEASMDRFFEVVEKTLGRAIERGLEGASEG